MRKRTLCVETKARIPVDVYDRLEKLRDKGEIESINQAIVEGAKMFVRDFKLNRLMFRAPLKNDGARA